jgi:drug/metabolite transporter (DMT)-like permease
MSDTRRIANAPRLSLDAASDAERRTRRAGIGLICLALVCFACLDTSGKWLGRHIPVWEIAWARYVGATVLVLIFVNPWTTPRMFATTRPFLQGFRACLLFASTVLNFLALRKLQLTETMTIAFAMPLVVSLLAGPMLGEWVGPRRLAAICVGFIGVIVLLQPGSSAFDPAALYSIAGLIAYAFYSVFTRMLASSDPSRTTVLYSAISGVLILTPLLPLFWVWPDDWRIWALLVLVGFFGGFGHWLLILAHARAPAAVLAPFVYTQIVWMTGLGFLVFGDVPGPYTIVGALIVVASGLYLFTRERAHSEGA